MSASETAKTLLIQALQEVAAGQLEKGESTLIRLGETGERIDAVHHNLGVIAMMRGQRELAAHHIEKTLLLNPRYTKAHANLASVYIELERYEEAVRLCFDAAALNPGDAKAYYNMALALRLLNRPLDALAPIKQAVSFDAGNASYVKGLADTLVEANRHHDALPIYNSAVALDPRDLELRFHRSAVALQLGHFAEGFEDYELRWFYGGNVDRLTEHDRPRWVNQFSIAGRTILMQVEQGLGDNIQFARYAELLTARGAKVILQVRVELMKLFKDFPNTVAVIAEGDELPPFDCFVPAMSLPLLLGTTVTTVPARARYISAPADEVAHWSPLIGSDSRPRIGIVWSGNPKHKNDKARSMPLSSFPIPNPVCFNVHALQQHVRASDQPLLDRLDIKQHGPELANMADTAAIVECMDLVITVDTSVAHLAGALGRPVWLLLPTNADWRWLHGRTDSPWYPTMRIFQQTAPGDWKGVFDQVTLALVDLLKPKVDMS